MLGLGGWFTGVLVVLVALPTVPLDDQVLAASRSRRRSGSPSTAAGSTAAHGGVAACAAVCAAILGAWLGFHVPRAPASER